ncbi:TPA: hypothetical protein ACWSA7_005393, partial [Escherichia coli]
RASFAFVMPCYLRAGTFAPRRPYFPVTIGFAPEGGSVSEAVRSFILNIHSRVFRGQFRPYNFLLSVKEEFIWLKWLF